MSYFAIDTTKAKQLGGDVCTEIPQCLGGYFNLSPNSTPNSLSLHHRTSQRRCPPERCSLAYDLIRSAVESAMAKRAVRMGNARSHGVARHHVGRAIGRQDEATPIEID